MIAQNEITVARRHVRRILIACLSLALTPSAGVATPMADSLYNIAVSRMDSMTVDEAIREFRKVLDEDPSNAASHYQLHRLQMKRATPSSRYQAEVHLIRAMRLEPDNHVYSDAWPDLLWSKGFRSNALREYEILLKEDPNNAQALYGIARQALHVFMMSLDQNPDMKPGQERDSDKAKRLLTDCIELAPEIRDAHYGLALLFYELGRPKQMAHACTGLLARFPTDPNGLLFKGLAHQKNGEMAEASEAYAAALAAMRAEERAVMESVDYLLPEPVGPEKLDLMQVADPLTVGAMSAFWTGQDPLFLTSFNERHLEHYARVAYANLRYSQPIRGVEGWRTDPGKALIKFGLPLFRMPGPTRDGLLKTERWIYEDFQLVFLLMTGTGNWNWFIDTGWLGPRDIFKGMIGRMPGPITQIRRNTRIPASWFKPLPQKILATGRPRYLDPYKDRKYDLPTQVAAFRTRHGLRLEVSAAVPKSEVRVAEPDGFVHLYKGVFLFDKGWQPIHRGREEVLELESLEADSLRKGYLLWEDDLQIESEPHHIVLEIEDLETGSIGSFRRQHEIVFPDSGLMMSDVLLAMKIEPQTPFPKGRDDLEIRPNPLRIYRRSEPIPLYFEIYGLTRDSFGRTEYEVVYEVGWPDQEADLGHLASLFEGVGTEAEAESLEIVIVEEPLDAASELERTGDPSEDLFAPEKGRVVGSRTTYINPGKRAVTADRGDKDRVWETAVTALYEGEREFDLTYLRIDASQVPAGIHELRVTVSDRKSGETLMKQVLFALFE